MVEKEKRIVFCLYDRERSQRLKNERVEMEQMSTRTYAPINGVKERKATWAKEREWAS
jgi:hypothetical protein